MRPGDSVRIAHVLDAIVPDMKASEPEVTFPGVLGRLALAGRGRTNRLSGVGVLSVCDWAASGLATPETFPDAFVNMAGPGRSMTAWGDRTELVVTCTPNSGAPVADVDRSVRMAALRWPATLRGQPSAGRLPPSIRSTWRNAWIRTCRRLR